MDNVLHIAASDVNECEEVNRKDFVLATTNAQVAPIQVKCEPMELKIDLAQSRLLTLPTAICIVSRKPSA